MDDEKYSDHPRRNDYLYGLFYKRVDPTYIGSPFGWFPVPLEAFLGGNYWGGGSTTSLIFHAVFYWRGTVLRWLGITPEFICITRTCVCYTCHMVAVFGAVRSP